MHKESPHTNNPYEKPSHTNNLYKKPPHTNISHKKPSVRMKNHHTLTTRMKNHHILTIFIITITQTNIMRINIFIVMNQINKHKAKIYNHCNYTQIILKKIIIE